MEPSDQWYKASIAADNHEDIHPGRARCDLQHIDYEFNVGGIFDVLVKRKNLNGLNPVLQHFATVRSHVGPTPVGVCPGQSRKGSNATIPDDFLHFPDDAADWYRRDISPIPTEEIFHIEEYGYVTFRGRTLNFHCVLFLSPIEVEWEHTLQCRRSFLFRVYFPAWSVYGGIILPRPAPDRLP